MKSKNLIEEKLLGNHKDFLKYCQESRKIFVEELDREDFIAYRSEYAVSHEDIEELKNLLNFQEQFSPLQNVFDDSEVILQDYFKITDLAPYENISIDNFNFSNRIKKLLKQNNCRTLAELLKHSIKSLSQLNYLGKVYIEVIFETLKSFFETQKKTFIDSQQIISHEEVSQSLKNIPDEYEGTLQKYFNISDLTPYENVLISDLGFERRVQWSLNFNGYMTFADILKSSTQEIRSLKIFGQSFFDNLFATMKKFLETQNKTSLGFSEQISKEIFQSPKDISDSPKNTLQDYFEITDLTPYENVYIADLDFSVRVKNCLVINGFTILVELLNITFKELFHLKNFKASIFDDLLETLKKYFKTLEENSHDLQEPVAVESILEESEENSYDLQEPVAVESILEESEENSYDLQKPVTVEIILEEPEETLQDYLKITDLTPYENVYIADLDFSVRVKNCLRRNGYKTLDELIKLSRQTLSNLRNLGQNSIDDIFKTLKFFFDTYDSTGTNSTEIQPLKKTLQEIFNIVYLPPYEDILITDLDFDNHVKNYLARNDCKTLADLLKLSEYNLLSSFGYFGHNSFDNILKILKKFFDARRKKIPAKTLRLANEGLDEFLRNAALNHAPQVDFIISAFEKFSDLVTIKSAFRNLPEEFRDKRVRSFFLACGLKKNNFFVDLPDDLTLSELPEYLSENNFAFDFAELKKFVDELNFDVRVATKKILTNLFENERDFEIVRRRAGGATLEQVGQEFNLTRERIRQIEAKLARRFRHPKNGAKKIFYFIHALTDGKFFLTLDDAKNFLDTSDAKMLWFFVIKALKDEENLGIKKFNYDKESDTEIFNYDKESNAFVFHHGAVLDEETLIKNLPDIMEEKFFEETITNLASEKKYPVDFMKIKLSKIYKRSGKFFHRVRLTPTFKCEYILKERFPNGYKISDETYYSSFIRYLQEIFDEKTPTNQRALGALISTIGVLCDRGKYIHPDFVHIPPEVMERVKNFIDNSERTAIYYKAIFESLKNIFVGTQIMNHYFLQGVIKFYKLPYTLCKDYLTKVSGVDMVSEFYNFVAKHPEFSLQEIKDNFISLTDASINFFLLHHPLVIRIGDGNFINTLCLDLREEDFEQIENFLRRNCSNPISSRVLLDLFFEHFPDFMSRNEIHDNNKLFGLLQHMFRDEFNFSRPYISVADIKDINNKKVLLRLLESMEEIEIEDLIGICAENGIHYVARTCLIDSLRPDFVRVDEFTLMRPESIGVTDEIISAVVENIQSAIGQNGGWQSAQTFEDYEWLPQLEISWNSFLLESVATLAEDVLYKIKVPSTSTNFSLAIFVAEEFAEDDYQSFLTKILIAEHNKEPFRTEKEIFDWLKMQGLCNKRLPKFLQEGRAFEILGE